MKMFRKAAALAAALALTAGCSGGDTSWVAKSGEDTIPAGVYLVELMMGYNDASGQLPGSEDILKESIGETPAPTYITDFAKTECAKLLAVREQFLSRGLTLTEDDQAQADSYTDYLYSMGENFYNANGVAKESVQYINDTTMMSLAVFNSIYGEGGEKEVTRQELQTAFADTYTRSQYMLFPKVDVSTGAPLDEEALAANKAKAEAYYQRALAGESFPGLTYELAKESNPEGAGEQMADNSYDVYLENNAGFYPPVYEESILKAADNEVLMVEDEYYVYLLKKLPILGGDEVKVQNYMDNLLQNMKYDEYMETVAAWSQELDVTYNNAALAAYTPAKLKMTQEQMDAASSGASSSESGSSESASSSGASGEAGSSQGEAGSDASSNSAAG